MSGQKPINLAYLRNLITDRDFRDMTSLYDTFRDPAKSRWFDYAKDAFYSRFGGTTSPAGEAGGQLGRGGPPPDAMELFLSYLMGLDGAVRAQDLKGAQIRECANKMLDDVHRMYLAAGR
jgi:hypothetical protein